MWYGNIRKKIAGDHWDGTNISKDITVEAGVLDE